MLFRSQTYGHQNLNESVHLVTLRLTAVGKLDRLEIIHHPDTVGNSEKSRRAAWFADVGTVECAVHDRNRLDATSQLTGPAIVESLDSTLVIPPGWSASNDHRGFITMERHHNE